jgi:hypothetical protein
MQVGRLTAALCAVVVIGGAVAAVALRAPDDGGLVHAAPGQASPPAVESTKRPDHPDSYYENMKLVSAYVPGAADEFELEQFWRSCEPVGPEHLAQLASELEQRVRLFEAVHNRRAPGPRPEPPKLDGEMTQEQFLEYYGPIGFEEARFLLEECTAGRMRKTPFQPIPPTTLDNSHPTVQLVPHISPTLNCGFVARLDSSANQHLFDERPVAYAIAKRVLQEGGATAAVHDHAAHMERDAQAR